MDAGAIKLEFFSLAFDLISKRLLEGDDEQGYLPKRIGVTGNVKNYEVMGLLIYHSFIQGETLFSRFQPWIFEYIKDPKDTELLKLIISEADIPRNAGNEALLMFIDQLKAIKSNEELQELCCIPQNSEKINSNQWDICDSITLKQKKKQRTGCQRVDF